MTTSKPQLNHIVSHIRSAQLLHKFLHKLNIIDDSFFPDRHLYHLRMFAERAYKKDFYAPNPPEESRKLSLAKLNRDPIKCIKLTRQLMFTLTKLGLKTPDGGLKVCKYYFDRCRVTAGWFEPR